MTIDAVGSALSKHGQTTVGASIVGIVPNRVYKAVKGIVLKAPGADDATPNTNPVWVGYDGVATTDGFALAPGETLTLPITDPERLQAISDAAAQSLFWFIL